MGKFGEKQRRATDVVHEVRVEESRKHEEQLARHTAHLCIHGWRDVLWITGALGLGLALGKIMFQMNICLSALLQWEKSAKVLRFCQMVNANKHY